jgi:uncharacterized protein (TIGR01777 family)
VRRTPRDDAREIFFDPLAGRIDGDKLEGLDAIVHLAGENIAGGSWSRERKQRIRSSRVDGTRLIAETLAGLERPPRTLIQASAIGFYGDRGDEKLDETSPQGSGFLADLSVEWEGATNPAVDAGVRVVLLRIGIVLSRAGGALPKMLRPFKLGLGGKLGRGRQFMSWIALRDLIDLINFCLGEPTLVGPVNAVAPTPVRNEEFTRVLAALLHRPAFMTAPAAALRLALGEMADEMLLSSARISPHRAEQAGFHFRLPDLESALRFELFS